MNKIILIISGLLVITGCTKSGVAPNGPAVESLIDVKWKLAAVSGVLSDGSVTPDDYSGLPSYKKDDYYLFKSDSTFTYNDNIDKSPGSSSSIIYQGRWQLDNNDLQLSGSGISFFSNKILSLSSSELILESLDPSTGAKIKSTYNPIP